MGFFSNARTVKESGKSSYQQRRANGESYQKQLAKSAGRTRSLAPRQSDNKRKGW